MYDRLLNTLRDVKYRLTAPSEGWAHYFQLSTSPLIFHIAMNRDLRPLFSQIGNRRSYFLIPFWHDVSQFDELKKYVNAHRRRYPEYEFIFLANTEEQLNGLRHSGLQGEFVNHNALVDERLFFPIQSMDKRYDAVYDAQIAPYKRHELAREVKSLALICFVHEGLTTPEYVCQVRTMLRHAHWLNYSENQWRGLDFHEVNLALNQSRVGLCLSASEGAMCASIQYLLSGLPIVSTPSRGGRDVFFHEDFVRIVPPDPSAVAEAVAEMVQLKLDPIEIRTRTLSRIIEHRERFIKLVQSIYDRENNGRDFRAEWGSLFFNKMHRFQKLQVKNVVTKPDAKGPWG